MKTTRNISLEIHKALLLAEKFDLNWAIRQQRIEFYSVKAEEYKQIEKLQEQGRISLIEAIKGKRYKYDKVAIEIK